MISTDPTILKKFGTNLRKHRKHESQKQFALRMNISRGYLSDLERGERQVSLETMVHIYRALGTTPNTMLGYRRTA